MTSQPLPTLEEIRAAIFGTRLPSTQEHKMQAAIADRLTAAGIGHQREHSLGGNFGRIDFSIETTGGLVGFECKTHSTPMQAARQLHKYGQSGQFTALVLITVRPYALPIDAVQHNGAMIPVHQWQTPAL